MNLIEELGLALGLASLAGVNLYLTVLLTGALVRFDWIKLADSYQNLEVLGHPMVLAVAGVLFVLEFFADKIPWVDSLWDSVHTVIRPVGGTLLGLQALGEIQPWMAVIAGLLAGGAALTTHSAKASTRLLINHSPEPFSNVAMSFTEDIAVAGGAFLVLMKPAIALGVFSVIIVVIWMIFPRIWRVIRTSLWFIWNKLRMPGVRRALGQPVDLPRALDGAQLTLLAAQASMSEAEITWAVPCVTGKCKGVRGLKSNHTAMLVARDTGDTAYLAVACGLRDLLVEIPLAAALVEVESRFLSENMSIETDGKTILLRFPRGQSDVVETVAMRLREKAAPVIPAANPVAEAPVEESVAPVPAL